MSIDTADRHVPVLRERIVDLLSPPLSAEGAVYVDGTLGMGGHAEVILAACPHARVIGIDRDGQALALASERLAPYGERFHAVRARYDQIDEVVADAGLTGVQAVLLDLGVSSLQLDEEARGFAYRHDAPLDMRMDEDLPRTAADLLNEEEPGELVRILREYGEERFARQIVRAVVAERERAPFTTSARLTELLYRVIPAASRVSGGHPAKRTFQALRIAVNGELDSLAAALPKAVEVCALGGRVAVLSYHSLEDRMTKRVFTAGTTSSAPPDMPVELPEHAPYLAQVTRGAEKPDAAEVEGNPRAASARLRVVQRIAPTPAGRGSGALDAAAQGARRTIRHGRHTTQKGHTR